PHGRENAELGHGWCAADEGTNALVFVALKPMRGGKLGTDPLYARSAPAALWAAVGLELLLRWGLPRRSPHLRCTPRRFRQSGHASSRIRAYAAAAKWSARPTNSPRPSMGPRAGST